jgi:two-component system, cell cycle response regulator
MRILAAEDNPVCQLMLSRMLSSWGYEVVQAGDGVTAWQILQGQDPPRLAVLDWEMPGMDGVEICRRLRANGAAPYTYVVLLTARAQSGDLVAGMDAGADDYLTKPFNAEELRARLRAGRRILDLQEQLLHTQDALRRQATYDGLTGLLNRAAILEFLDREISRCIREGSSVAVLMADLDRFKNINDSYGHLAGDAILCEVAKRMQSEIRGYDAVGRYGGEEFLVVLPGCDLAAGQAQAERLRHRIVSRTVRAGSTALAVSCSIGVSWRAGPAQVTADALIHEADVALYAAKEAGRNRVTLFPTAIASSMVLSGAV